VFYCCYGTYKEDMYVLLFHLTFFALLIRSTQMTVVITVLVPLTSWGHRGVEFQFQSLLSSVLEGGEW
jgi:hypothetical protein